MVADEVSVVPLVAFRQVGVDDNGRVQGRFEGTGNTPMFSDHIQSHGVTLPPDLFRHIQQVT
jgi:pilus assembly protein CpaF